MGHRAREAILDAVYRIEPQDSLCVCERSAWRSRIKAFHRIERCGS